MTPSEILMKHENANEYHFHEVDRKWIIEAMEEFETYEEAENFLINELLNISNYGQSNT